MILELISFLVKIKLKIGLNKAIGFAHTITQHNGSSLE